MKNSIHHMILKLFSCSKLIWIILITAGGFPSCIDRYYSDYNINYQPKLVIDATICPDEGMQEIVISQTSSPDDPKFIPVVCYDVRVEDDKGNIFPFYYTAEVGHYRGEIEGSKVIIGAKYRLSVTTHDGKTYQSSFEELLPCPPIDSVYCNVEQQLTNNPNITYNGLQFYTDFKADDTYGHYYRYELIETYEYHAEYPLQKWQDDYGMIRRLEDADFSNMICYKTTRLRNIFDLSTKDFSNNSYPKFKLHYVKDQSPPLKIKYSLLLNQYSIDQKAYNYWENMRKNNQEATDLFGKQPVMIKGNIVNVKDSSDVALGYFQVSTVQRKRIMVVPIPGLRFDHAYVCKALAYKTLPKNRLIYLAVDFDALGAPYEGIVSGECIFCQRLGGTTDKPPYWDEK